MEPPLRPRSVIKREYVQQPAPPAEARGAHPAPAVRSARNPGARLVDLGDGALAVEFTCTCGEVSLIELQKESEA